MIRYLVRHPTTVLLAALAIFVFGLQSYRSLPREAAPDVQIPVVMITTPYVGVSPEDVEGLVTIPLENELAALKDVKRMSSTSAEGASIISIEFEPDVVIEDALQKVRDRVSRARPKLPDDVEEPAIREISMSDVPIMILTLAGGVDEERLKDLAEKLQDEITRIPGVLEARLSGGLEREIRVEVDPLRLAHYGLSLGDVIGAIGSENVNIPGGEVRSGSSGFLLRVPGEFTDPVQIEQVAVKRVGDRPVLVRDVARVVDGYEERTTYARMNGQPAVSLSVTKRSGANVVELAARVKELVGEQAAGWPAGVSYRVLSDQSKWIGNMVSELENNILTALLLVVGVVLVAMGLRNSIFVALSIPLSMMMAFLAVESLGFTLNMVVLFALILALGMLVDNAIVVIENVYRHLEEGKDRLTAAIDGTREVAGAVAASTATTVAAFFPLVFWTGIMGKFMGFLPKTVIIVLTGSLIAAVLILPVLVARLMRPGREPGGEPGEPGPVMSRYRALLEWSIRHRYRSALLGLATLVGTVVIYAFFNHGTEFFPDVDPNRATISVRLPDGANIEATDRVVRRIESILAAEPDVDVYVAESGVSGGGSRLAGTQEAANRARISVDFLPDRNSAGPGEEVRHEGTRLTIERLRRAVQPTPGAEITVEKERMGPPVGAPVSVEVSGDDFATAGALAQRVRRRLGELPGVTDLEDDYRVGRPEMRLRVDRGAVRAIGIDSRRVGSTVRTAVAGTVASKLREGDDEYDITVELAPEFREDLQSVLGLRLPGREMRSPDTFPVPLSSVASYELAGGSGAIRHVNQDPVVTITGDVARGYNENAVRASVQRLLDGFDLPEGYHLRLGGADDEQRQARAFLSRAFMVAIALILMVLVTEFDSIALPAIIMATVVLSLVGVLWGLLLTGTPFGVVMTGIGVISLAGVVVNNAIVLLDYVQKLRQRGFSVHDALVRAGMVRFRPVMLTAITTILGLVPMALGLSVDFGRGRLLYGGRSAQWWGPMAWAVVFGLAFATLLTLVLVPTFYSIREDLVQRFSALRARVGGRRLLRSAAKGLLLGSMVAAAGRQARALTLEEAMQAAERHDAEIGMLHERTLQTSTLRGQALALMSPKLSLGASYTINEYAIVFDPSDMIPEEYQALLGGGGEPIEIMAKDYFAGNASVQQPLFSAQALPLLRGALHTVRAARYDERSRRARVLAGAARAYCCPAMPSRVAPSPSWSP